jgi:CBS domain-containing membrane protein
MISLSLPGGKHPFRAGAGAGLAVGGILLLAGLLLPAHPGIPLLLASTGASAVLVFAVPASPLAQPWPVIGGSLVSAVVGVTVVKLVGDGPLAVALAMGLALLAMQFAQCLHPPGGAVALAAVVGGPAVHEAGYAFLWTPLGLNAVALVVVGIIFNNATGSRYPHRAEAGAPRLPAVLEFDLDDIEEVLDTLEDRPDIDPEDLEFIIRSVEARVLERNHVGAKDLQPRPPRAKASA